MCLAIIQSEKMNEDDALGVQLLFNNNNFIHQGWVHGDFEQVINGCL